MTAPALWRTEMIQATDRKWTGLGRDVMGAASQTPIP